MDQSSATKFAKEFWFNIYHQDYFGAFKAVLLIVWSYFPSSLTKGISNFLSPFPQLVSYLPLIVLIIFIAAILFIIRIILGIKRSLKEDMVILELTPPARSEKTHFSTQKFFDVINDLGKHKSWIDRLLGKRTYFSFEIVSTKVQGIRYLIKTPPKYVNNFKRDLLSYLPQVTIKTVDEYLPEQFNNYHFRLVEFKLAKRFANPLQKQNVLDELDPVSYTTNQMTKLSDGELIAFQMVVSRTTSNEKNVISRKLRRGEDVIKYLNSTPYPIYVALVSNLIWLMAKLVVLILSPFVWLIHEFTKSKQQSYRGEYSYDRQPSSSFQPKYHKNYSEQEEQTIKLAQEKLTSPLFEVSIRYLVLIKDKVDLEERVEGFSSSLGVFSSLDGQALVKKIKLSPFGIFDKYYLLSLEKRLLSFVFNKSSVILSSAEIADLYHFPYTNYSHAEDLVESHSNELSAPLEQKQTEEFDVILGQNTYGGEVTLVGLRGAERYRHLYLLGGTGSGKSTMLLYMILQDIENGKGLILIDPHGDLAVTIAMSIPKHRKKDVIYWNPKDIKNPISLNLLQMTEGLDEDEALLEKEVIVEHIISIFRKVFSNDLSSAGGNAIRIEHIFRNALYTALELKNPTLATVFDLLVNPIFRSQALESLKNERLKNFWRFEFNKAGDMQRVSMSKGINARIERFLFSSIAFRVMEKYISTIDFEKIMDEGKILICNFSKGRLGDDNTSLFGTMVLGEIQLAALKRAEIDVKDRKDFYVYVDEFQHFATKSFIEMMAESRKYGVYIIIAEQSTSQQRDPNLVDVTFANVGTVVMFKNANTHDEQIVLPLFKPYIAEGQIANLPTHRCYIKISAVNPQKPFSAETILIDIKPDKEKLAEIIRLTHEKYAPAYEKPKVEEAPKVKISSKEGKTNNGADGAVSKANGNGSTDDRNGKTNDKTNAKNNVKNAYIKDATYLTKSPEKGDAIVP